MKKLLMMFTTLVLSFAFAVNVMANDSPEKGGKNPDKYTEAGKVSTSPKTDDQGVPATLVYVSLAAAAVSVYAAKRLKEQH